MILLLVGLQEVKFDTHDRRREAESHCPMMSGKGSLAVDPKYVVLVEGPDRALGIPEDGIFIRSQPSTAPFKVAD